MPMATIAVLGGGISGLSCAYHLKKLAKSKLKYLFLLEKSPKFGGWIQTTKFPDGAICEHGPRTIRFGSASGLSALSLAEELNLKYQILPITANHPAAQNRLILYKNKLHPLRLGIKYIFSTNPPLSKSLFRSMVQDFQTPKTVLSDTSLHEFGERRFGKEVADYILDPLCRGIMAADARNTSLRTMFPILYQYEQEYGSVLKGFFKNFRKPSGPSDFINSRLIFDAQKENWHMWSLRNGLTELIDAIACDLEEKGVTDLHVSAACEAITFKDNKAFIKVDGEIIEVDHVFSSLPASKLANLVPQYSRLSNLLSSVSAVTVAVVYLEYDGFVHKHDAFGFLTSSCEDSDVLGITFDSCCFPEHNGEARTRITCMIGGQWFNKVFGNSEVTEDQVLNVAIKAAEKHLNITVPPFRHHVAIQRDCIPRYEVNHLQKVKDICFEIKNNNLNLSVLGAWCGGAAVTDCIHNAKLTADYFVKNELK